VHYSDFAYAVMHLRSPCRPNRRTINFYDDDDDDDAVSKPLFDVPFDTIGHIPETSIFRQSTAQTLQTTKLATTDRTCKQIKYLDTRN